MRTGRLSCTLATDKVLLAALRERKPAFLGKDWAFNAYTPVCGFLPAVDALVLLWRLASRDRADLHVVRIVIRVAPGAIVVGELAIAPPPERKRVRATRDPRCVC